MRRLAAALVLSACQAQAQPAVPAPACADGQQNQCKCDGLDGVQMCSSGTYGGCDCSVAQALIAKSKETSRKRLVAQAMDDRTLGIVLALGDARDALDTARAATKDPTAIVVLDDLRASTNALIDVYFQ